MEQGPHAQLVDRPGGAYATLLKLQLQAQRADAADALLDANMSDDVLPPDAAAPLLVCCPALSALSPQVPQWQPLCKVAVVPGVPHPHAALLRAAQLSARRAPS